jgi:hypothetical protein
MASNNSNLFRSLHNQAANYSKNDTSKVSIHIDSIQLDKYVNYLSNQANLTNSFYTRQYSPLNFSSSAAHINFLFLFYLLDNNINNSFVYELALSSAHILLSCMSIHHNSAIDDSLLAKANEKDITYIFNLQSFNLHKTNDEAVKNTASSIVKQLISAAEVLALSKFTDFSQFLLANSTDRSAANLITKLCENFPSFDDKYKIKSQQFILELYQNFHSTVENFNFHDIQQVTASPNVTLINRLIDLEIIKVDPRQPRAEINERLQAEAILVVERICRQRNSKASDLLQQVSPYEIDFDLRGAEDQMAHLINLFICMLDMSPLLTNSTTVQPSFIFQTTQPLVPYFTRVLSEFLPTLKLHLQFIALYRLREFTIQLHNQWRVYCSIRSNKLFKGKKKTKPAESKSSEKGANTGASSSASTSQHTSVEQVDGPIKSRELLVKAQNSIFLAISMLLCYLVVEPSPSNENSEETLGNPNYFVYDTESRVFYAIISDILSYLEFRRMSFSAYKQLLAVIVEKGTENRYNYKSTSEPPVKAIEETAERVERKGKPSWRSWLFSLQGKKKNRLLSAAEEAENRAQTLVRSFLRLYLCTNNKLQPTLQQLLLLPEFRIISTSNGNMSMQKLLELETRTILPFKPYQSTNNSDNSDLTTARDLTYLSRQFFLLGLLKEWIWNVQTDEMFNLLIPFSWNYISVNMKGANTRANLLLLACFQRISTSFQENKDENDEVVISSSISPAKAHLLMRQLLPYYAETAVENYPKLLSFSSLTDIMASLFSILDKQDLLLLYFERLLLDKSLALLSRAKVGKPKPITLKLTTQHSIRSDTKELASNILLPPTARTNAPPAAIQSLATAATLTISSDHRKSNYPANKTTTLVLRAEEDAPAVILPPGLRQLILLQLQVIQNIDVNLFKQCLEMMKELFYSNPIACQAEVRSTLALIINQCLMRSFDLYKRDIAIAWYFDCLKEFDIEVTQLDTFPQMNPPARADSIN